MAEEHQYWCVSSSSNDEDNSTSELIKAKWLSLDNYVHNVHKKRSKEQMSLQKTLRQGLKENGLKDVRRI